MCYGNPTKSLAIARERMSAEQWAKFEADFEHFCAYSGLADGADPKRGIRDEVFIWARWAYLSARQTEPVIAQAMPDFEAHCDRARRYAEGADLVDDAYFEKIAIASMTDEQAQRSLQRFSMWQRMKGETA
jgi:hypothetical protein